MIDLANFLEDMPQWKQYYTVDELNVKTKKIDEEYNEVELLNLGKSTKGETIECLKVGEGNYNALIHGFPNCEEPIGGVLLEYLTRKLAEDERVRKEIDYTWYLIPCSDPDGARLCEGFQKGEQTIQNFSLNYYRTPVHLTPEWCFPFRFGPLNLNNPTPETRTLMNLMDRIDFHFISSLHQMKWGGVTYQVPHPCPELYPRLWESAKRFSILLRKRPGTTITPGVSHAQYLTPARGYLRHWANGNKNIEPITGCYIYEYGQMRNPHLFMMIPESTFWYDPRMWDDTPTDESLGDSLQFAQTVVQDVETLLLKVWKETFPTLSTESPFKAMYWKMLNPLINKETNVSNPTLTFSKQIHRRKATVAEKVAIEGREVSFRMTHLGGMVRLLDLEIEEGNTKVKEHRDQVYNKLIEFDKYLQKNFKVVLNPIKNNVGMSISSIIHSAEYSKKRQP
jgi:hypothetical protein